MCRSGERGRQRGHLRFGLLAARLLGFGSSSALWWAVPSAKEEEGSMCFQAAVGFPREEQVSPPHPARSFAVVSLRQRSRLLSLHRRNPTLMSWIYTLYCLMSKPTELLLTAVTFWIRSSNSYIWVPARTFWTLGKRDFQAVWLHRPQKRISLKPSRYEYPREKL